jgi:hypothetical protein
MYEVLALSMRIDGRPPAEIERVLLSQVDFTAADVPSMLYSAAYLTRLGAAGQALHLYRQASQLQPTRPEPYVLGLKLARGEKDAEAVRWAAAGVLAYAWMQGHEDLHREAEIAAEQTQNELAAAGRSDEARLLADAIREARKRDLVLKLTWSGPGELDLIVEEPGGAVCSFDNPYSPAGGVLVHDGFGPNQDNCYEEYVCAFGVPGNYTARIRHISGNIVGKRARLTIVRYAGTPEETERTCTVPIARVDQTVHVALARGRRTELQPVGQSRLTRRTTARRGPLNVAAEIGKLDPYAEQIAAQFAGGGQQGFVTGGQPVVGGGAVGFQPVVQVISEGVTLGALAIISGDRRYVRLNVTPSFSNITDVFTFSFVESGGGQGAGAGAGAGAGGQGAGGQAAGN